MGCPLDDVVKRMKVAGIGAKCLGSVHFTSRFPIQAGRLGWCCGFGIANRTGGRGMLGRGFWFCIAIPSTCRRAAMDDWSRFRFGFIVRFLFWSFGMRFCSSERPFAGHEQTLLFHPAAVVGAKIRSKIGYSAACQKCVFPSQSMA